MSWATSPVAGSDTSASRAAAIGDRGRGPAAGRGKPVHRGLLVIVPGHLVAGPDQVRGHRAAHNAQADESDARHAGHLQPKLVELSAGSDGLYSQPIQPAQSWA